LALQLERDASILLDEFVHLYNGPVPLKSDLKSIIRTNQHIESVNVHILGDTTPYTSLLPGQLIPGSGELSTYRFKAFLPSWIE
jgi:hypothetical protein